MNYIEATYLLSSEKKFDPEVKIKDYIKKIFGDIKHLPEVADVDSFYDSDLKIHKALVKIKYPVILFRHDMSSVLSILYGEIVIPENIKLINLDFHPAFLDHFKGPNFGVKGIKDAVGIHHRPLIAGTLVALNGISREKFKDIVTLSAEGGLDIIRESEIFFDDAMIPFEERVKIASDIVSEFSQKSGKTILYSPFITGSITEITEKISMGIEQGIHLFTLNLFPLGFENLQFLSDTFRAGFIVNPGYPPFFFENDLFGIQPTVFYGRFLRMAGADLIIIPSPYRNRTTPHHRSVEVASSLTEHFEDIKPSMPVIYGDIKPKDVYSIFTDFGNQIVIDIKDAYTRHKKGIKEGAKAYMDIIECVVSGSSYEECKIINPDITDFDL